MPPQPFVIYYTSLEKAITWQKIMTRHASGLPMVSANYKGFLHTAYAVSLCVEQQDRLLLVTKWLYPDVARKYGTNWKAVERNIRTVSTIAWKHNLPLLESLSHRHLDRRLRSAEFLAVLFHAVCSDEFERPA